MTNRLARHSMETLFKVLGFRADGGAVVDDAVSIVGAIGVNNADNAFSSSSIVANGSGSVLERLAYLQAGSGVGALAAGQATYLPQVASKTLAGTALTTGLSPVTAFTVTGTVLVRLWAFIGTLMVSTSNNGTLAVGVSGSTAAFNAAATVDATNFVTGAVWAGDTSPTLKAEALSANALNAVLCASSIIVTVATNSCTAGSITLFAEWRPVSSGATLVAA